VNDTPSSTGETARPAVLDGVTQDDGGNVTITAPAAVAIVEILTDGDPED